MSLEIRPYSYFEGPNKVTFCCEGKSSDADAVRASAVYFPNPEGSRKRITTKTLHEKAIFDGTSGEETQLPSPLAQETIPALYRTSGTERYISVKESDITHLYDPAESLRIILSQKDLYPSQIIHKLQTALDFLMRHGFSRNDLGIYGGLQSFLLQNNANKPLKDIDISVTGTQYVPLIQELARLTQLGKVFPFRSRVRHVNEEMRTQRHRNTKIYLPNDQDDAYCDIKVLRSPVDQNSFPTEALPTTEASFVARIIDDKESISLPCSYLVETTDGRRLTISSNRYDFIAVAKKGDYVQVTGLHTTQEQHILLTDPQQHSLLALADTEVR